MGAPSDTSRYAKGFDIPVRGDTITADRYISQEFMALENQHLWPKVWHLGGFFFLMIRRPPRATRL